MRSDVGGVARAEWLRYCRRVKEPMTLEAIAARMREIESRFDAPPFSTEESLNMIAEYMELEDEWNRRTGRRPETRSH